jgi:lipoprotein-anchoring transpeptidase ErfK/SrfK
MSFVVPTRRGGALVAVKRLAFIAVAITAVSLVASVAFRGSAPVTVTPHFKVASAPVLPLAAAPPGSTLVANVHKSIPGYANPKDAPTVTIAPTWHGAASALPVVWAAPGWVDVGLPQRPNGSTAWVRDSDVTFSSTAYRIVINLQSTSLSLYKSGQLQFTVPAGVGTSVDPTPTGHFFVAFFAAPPSPGYGSFVIVSSAHSNTISDWESSGDALMAIHGPLGDDSEIGTTGAHISHGCVRLHNADLVRLRGVPTGTPIDVVAS